MANFFIKYSNYTCSANLERQTTIFLTVNEKFGTKILRVLAKNFLSIEINFNKKAFKIFCWSLKILGLSKWQLSLVEFGTFRLLFRCTKLFSHQLDRISLGRNSRCFIGYYYHNCVKEQTCRTRLRAEWCIKLASEFFIITKEVLAKTVS